MLGLHVAIGTTLGLIVITTVFLFWNQKKPKVKGSQEQKPVVAHSPKPEHVVEPSPNDEPVLTGELRPFEVLQITQVSHNVKLFAFKLPDNRSLDLPVGRHVTVVATIDGNEVSKPYTPVTLASQKGFFELVIKAYNGGRISGYMHNLKVGDFVQMKGPAGRFVFEIEKWRHVVMIAGGTGITPILQVARAILDIPNNETKITLLFSNSSDEDILVPEKLDELEKTNPERLRVIHVVCRPVKAWEGEKGRITCELLEKYIPRGAEDIPVLICGPVEFNKAMIAAAVQLGYDEKNCLRF